MVAAAGKGTADREDAKGAGADAIVGGGAKGRDIMPKRAVKGMGRGLLQAAVAPIVQAWTALGRLWTKGDMAVDDALARLTVWQLRRQERWLRQWSQRRRLTKGQQRTLEWLQGRLGQELKEHQEWRRRRQRRQGSKARR